MADVVANGVRHHVQRLGGGEHAVVFVHGLVMDNLSSFYFTLANPIAERADVVLYDLRGHGLSERPARGYAVADFVADLADLLRALALDRPVDLVGNSFGGLLALAFAAAHPARVRRLALIDAHTGTDGWAAQMTATLALQGPRATPRSRSRSRAGSAATASASARGSRRRRRRSSRARRWSRICASRRRSL